MQYPKQPLGVQYSCLACKAKGRKSWGHTNLLLLLDNCERAWQIMCSTYIARVSLAPCHNLEQRLFRFWKFQLSFGKPETNLTIKELTFTSISTDRKLSTTYINLITLLRNNRYKQIITHSSWDLMQQIIRILR